MPDPLRPFLADGGLAILDGGLATELEKRGCDLDHPLWSARILRDAPDAIRAVHESYLEAGADIITTATYQATFPGFAREGLTHQASVDLMLRSVALATDARDAFWAVAGNRVGRRRPLVAASIGPYGAYLANGAEYTGAYDLDEAGLVAFHHERFRLLADSDADLLVCETIPSRTEALALATLLGESDVVGWLSFSCRDATQLSDGTPFAEVVRELSPHSQILALGINCTAPQHVATLLRSARGVTTKPLVTYPNSGEKYDASTRTWSGPASAEDWGRNGRHWHEAGARLIGGCCRTGPGHIRSLRAEMR